MPAATLTLRDAAVLRIAAAVSPNYGEGAGRVSHSRVLQRLMAEPARPESIRSKPNAYWYVVGTVCIGAFMGQLDASIVTVAFPTMQRHFHSSLGGVEWVALAYLLTLVGTVTAVGKFADMVGRKLLYTYGFAVFILASAACGLAPTLLSLDAFRVVQAMGAAMLQANSVALISNAMPPEKLGRGIGVQGAAQALGLSLGPTVGGLLISLGGYRLIFYVNVPVGLVGIALAWFLLPRSRHLQAREPFDWLGLALFFPAVAGLLAALSFGRRSGFGSPLIIGLFVAFVVLGVAFLRRERTTRSPMLDLTLFRRGTFAAGISSGFLSYSVLFGVLFIVPFYLQGPRHMSTGSSGLVLTALPFALGLVAPFAGRVADKVGARPLTVGGMVVTALGLLAMVFVHGSTGLLVVELAVVGAGLGAFTPPNNAAIMGSAPREQSGMAGGVLNMTRGIGTAMGVALTGLVFAVLAGAASDAGNHAGPGTTRGFVGGLLLLVALSVVAAVFAAARGNTEIVNDPMHALAE